MRAPDGEGRDRTPKRPTRGSIPVASPAIGGWLLPLHGWSATTPMPHWAVLLAAVPCLWLAIGGGVVVVERVLGALLESS